MVDIKTPLSILHRPSRKTAPNFIGRPGLWAYIDSHGFLTNIATDSIDQHQPKVLKFLINEANETSLYTRNDTKVGRIATLEGIFRASVDGEGFQIYDTLGLAITYNPGDPLTTAYRITTSGTSDFLYSDPEDIGKLRPAGSGDLVVARVEKFNNNLNILDFITVTPYPYGGDDIWGQIGRGRLASPSGEMDGEGDHEYVRVGSGDTIANPAEITGEGSSGL